MFRPMKDSGVDWIGDIPENWKIHRNKNAFDCTKNIVGNLSSTTQLLSLTTKGIIKKDINATGGKLPETFDTYQYVKAGEMVMCLFDLDCSAVFSGLSKYDGMISPAYKVLQCSELIVPGFAEYWFSNIFNGRKYMHYAKNLRYTLNYDEFATIPIAIPSSDEQQRIADFLDSECAKIDSIIEKTKTTIEEYKSLKQSVITEAVTKGIRGDRPMKDSGIEWIGEIPEEWETIRTKYIGTTQNGISKSADCFGKGYPFVSYGDVYRNYELPRIVDGLVESSVEEQEKYSVKNGDILFTRTSETIEEVGFASVCKSTIPNATFAGFVIRLRPYEVDSTIHTDYAKYYYRSSLTRAYLVKEMNLVTRASLSQGLLGDMWVVLPPLKEQTEIADYLNEKCASVDALISKKEDIITELETYKKSLIYEYVTGKKEVKA